MLKSIEVVTEVSKKPAGVLLYSRSGMGKSTFLIDCIKKCENGILFQCGEDSLADLDPEFTKDTPHYADIIGDGITQEELAQGWVDFKDIIKYLMVGEHNFKRAAFDNFDNIINNNLDQFVTKEYYNNNLKEANSWGGAKLKEMYSELALIVKGFEYIQKKRGVSIFLSSHAQPINFKDPAEQDYKKWSLAIPAREDYNLRTLLINWSSTTLFGTDEVNVENKKATDRRRVLKTIDDASWEAKCRYNIPSAIDFSYDSFSSAVTESRKKDK